ncbi:MAG: (Fe-S)-binding protein [Thermoleophilia bacterium]|nr:(Fe-S)-binding protein [Thermoleophilia bacterium]
MAAAPRAAAPTRIEELRPFYDEVAKCGKCGFCQPACPVYRATSIESHVARGKNALFRNLIEGRTVMDEQLTEAFENCLLCRACTANCFSAVKTDRLVVAFRESYARRFGRPWVQRWIFRNLLPSPGRMACVIRLAWAARRLGLVDAANRLGLLAMINPKLPKALALRDEVPAGFLRDRLRTTVPTPPQPRLRVGYWISCGFNYMLPEVGEATVRELTRQGAAVTVLKNACCGLPVYGYGDLEGARALARRNIDSLGDLDRFDFVVSECGSCSGHLKEYPGLLAGDPEYSVRAARLVRKVRAFTELLVELVGVDPADLQPVEAVVTYHDPCHMTERYQGVVSQPREIIRAVPGVDFRELNEADACCGAAGSYTVMHNDISMKILERKTGNVEHTGAGILITECPACIMQLALGARRRGLDIEVLSVSQLLERARREQGGA